MDQDISKRIAELEAKLDKVYESSEKTRKYFLWLIGISVVLFVLPLLAVIPMMNSLMETYSSLGNF